MNRAKMSLNRSDDTKRSKYTMKRILGDFCRVNSLKSSTLNCLVKPTHLGTADPVVIRTIDQNGEILTRLGNVFFCKSLFWCPYCTETKQNKYKKRAESIITALFERYKELDVHFATYTVRHKRFDSLKVLINLLIASYREVHSDRQVNKMRKNGGYLGTDRWLEITYGYNGFHPHIHALHFYSQKSEQTGRFTHKTYLNILRKKGNFALEKGQDLQVDLTEKDAIERARYAWSTKKVIKTTEMLSVKKKSFFLTSRLSRLWSLFDPVLKEYLENTMGRHGHQTSRELLQIIGEEDLKETDNKDGDDDLEQRIYIPRSLWVRANSDKTFIEVLMSNMAKNFSVDTVLQIVSPFSPSEHEVGIIKLGPISHGEDDKITVEALRSYILN